MYIRKLLTTGRLDSDKQHILFVYIPVDCRRLLGWRRGDDIMIMPDKENDSIFVKRIKINAGDEE